ncbi:hypothetical protein AURDEDRAFT_170204 [Auricularia subglabra TFB-10046 SS5]|nr:hypothetical protein AURDEDRAFT_170204 [Auricularia subglabra TFB-10046 SS5]
MSDYNDQPLAQATRQALARVLNAQRRETGGTTSTDRIDSALRIFRALALRALVDILRAENMGSPLVIVPQHVLERICWQLSFADRVSLSHVCRAVRNKMLSAPAIWRDIVCTTRYSHVSLGPRSFDRLQDFLDRSGREPLILAVLLSPEAISLRWKRIALNMYRITSLTLDIHTSSSIGQATLSSPAFWNAALEALSFPAPLLEHLKLAVAEQEPNPHGDACFNWITYYPLPLSTSFLAGHVSRLRTCRLAGVKLPPMTFSHVTCFSFLTNSGLHLDEIARILAYLPSLVSLELSAPYFDGPGRHGGPPYCSPSAKICTSIRNLLLSAEILEAESLCSLIDFRRLRYLEVNPAFEASQVITAAYPEEKLGLLALSLGSGITIAVNNGPTIHAYYALQGFSALLGACSLVTNVVVHEFEWPSEWPDILPALPGVTSLSIRFATCAELAHQLALWPIEADGVGLFQFSGRWDFDALRELHISAAYSCTGTCGYEGCCGRCSGGVSISLRDIADFVRDRIHFDAPRLSVIRLSGLHVVDVDFVSAQNELFAFTESLVLQEDAAYLPGMDLPKAEGLAFFSDRFQDDE